MFYSQTFLGRKGPLGTVWCAAHLHHRLNKSQYISTDILSTVERIMYPDVPIALRMSGHLLLGVVRIYSKKVDYLFHDCHTINVKLIKAFDAKKQLVDLPDNQKQAPLQAITLPQTFDLDGFQVLDDDDIYTEPERSLDNHLSNEEGISLPDQIPTGRNLYVAIRFDEDMTDVLRLDSGDQPMDEHFILHPPVDANFRGIEQNATAAFQDGPSNQTQVPNIIFDDNFPQDFPEIEVRRDAIHDISNEGLPPGLPDQRNDVAETTVLLEKNLDDEDIHAPSLMSLSTSGGESMPFHEPPTSAPQESPGILFGHESPQLAIQLSPPVQQPRKRQRPQRRFFDNQLVLSDKSVRKALKDPSNLLQKRRKVHPPALAVWKSNNSLRKEQIFNRPSLTGICVDISDIFARDYIFAKPNLVVLQEAVSSRRISQSPAPSPKPGDVQFPPTATGASAEHSVGRPLASVPEIDRETEGLPDDQDSAYDNILHEFEPSPSRLMPSPGRGDSSPQGNTGLSDIPEMAGSAEADDLYFLEADNNSPTESQASQGLNSLSVRTRAVAQYLKRQLPVTPISENSTGDLSLKKMLEGKTRKLCARMFYETLVLKSYGLIDVQQEKAYEDIHITLKLTPMLSKPQI